MVKFNLILAAALFCWGCGRGTKTDSGTQDLKGPMGQIYGTMRLETRHFAMGEGVCIARFDASRQAYKVYAHVGGLKCDTRRREFVAREAVDYDKTAFQKYLVEQESNTAITVQMQYATGQIFPDSKKDSFRITQPLYGKGRCFLRKEVKNTINSAAILLKRRKGKSARLILLDCYRPAYVSEYMYSAIVSSQEFSHPDKWVAKRSSHNKGVAVDVTWGFMRGGQLFAVDMGSRFDEFSSKSPVNASGITSTQKGNRRVLQDIMGQAGFKPYLGEWWHFSLKVPGSQHLDLPL